MIAIVAIVIVGVLLYAGYIEYQVSREDTLREKIYEWYLESPEYRALEFAIRELETTGISGLNSERSRQLETLKEGIKERYSGNVWCYRRKT